MLDISDIVQQMRRNPKGIRFRDLSRVCEHYFGQPRQRSSSHQIYRTPWQGDPRINIQSSRGLAKVYQVKHVPLAIDKLEHGDGDGQG